MNVERRKVIKMRKDITDIKSVKLKSGTYELVVADLKEGTPNGYPWGYINFETKQIFIHSDLLDNPSLFYQVLFHEFTHEALMNSGVSSFLAENELTLEEMICDSVGFAMAEYVGKNPDLMDVITNTSRDMEENGSLPLFESRNIRRR